MIEYSEPGAAGNLQNDRGPLLAAGWYSQALPSFSNTIILMKAAAVNTFVYSLIFGN